jgi:ornithine cyclodeaminase/alanine dehydrogenase-like protein (mu-crystallin family)
MQIFDASSTRNALPFDRLIPALRAMFVSGCVVPPRHVHELNSPSGEGMTSLLMPAWQEGRCYGIKTINIAPGNAARGLPSLHATYVLFDAVTGVPLALIWTATRSPRGVRRLRQRWRLRTWHPTMPNIC